jgi:gamma-glutamyltranspeptidase/glutathione hydrolase
VQIWGTRGMVSSMHPTASQVGAEILRTGGNAVDAAVAVGAAMSVLSPDWAGPAGDSAWLVYLKAADEYRYLDGYSTCPAGITPQRIAEHFNLDPGRHHREYEEEPPGRRDVGMITGMVPGTPAAWCELTRRHAALSLEALLEPAIDIARHGFPVNQYLAQAVAANRDKLMAYASSRAVWFEAEGGQVREGVLLKQPELAATLERIARAGRDGFYRGDTADAIVKHCERSGGVMTHEDLAAYRCVWRGVLRGTYRGKDIIVTAPPTAGVHVLQALNILEGYALPQMPYHGVEALHLTIEALKLALADRRGAGGDPDFLAMDTKRLADKAYAAELRARIDQGRATPRGASDSTASSTTHFAVVDAMGNMVSATQTIGSRFGCGDTVAGTGLLMNDRTWWMSLAPGPNQVAPLHRANIGHAPTIVAQDGVPVATLGSPGGFGIVQYMVQVVTHMVDHGLDIQRAIEAARFKIEHLRGRVGFERRIDPATRAALAQMGHELFEFPEWSDRVGGIEGIAVDPATGVMLGGYDPRRNSMAVGI